MNFVDGLDGLAAGVVGIGALAFFAFCYQLTSLNNASLAIHRRAAQRHARRRLRRLPAPQLQPGARLHGRQRLDADRAGAVGERDHADRAVLRRRPEPRRHGVAGQPGCRRCCRWPLPITLLVVPIADLVLAVVRRTRAGRSPFAPDKQHLHHRLLEIGHSQRRAVLIMWMWAALVAGSTVLVSLYTGPLMWTRDRRAPRCSRSRSRSSCPSCSGPTLAAHDEA